MEEKTIGKETHNRILVSDADRAELDRHIQRTGVKPWGFFSRCENPPEGFEKWMVPGWHSGEVLNHARGDLLAYALNQYRNFPDASDPEKIIAATTVPAIDEQHKKTTFWAGKIPLTDEIRAKLKQEMKRTRIGAHKFSRYCKNPPDGLRAGIINDYVRSKTTKYARKDFLEYILREYKTFSDGMGLKQGKKKEKPLNGEALPRGLTPEFMTKNGHLLPENPAQATSLLKRTHPETAAAVKRVFEKKTQPTGNNRKEPPPAAVKTLPVSQTFQGVTTGRTEPGINAIGALSPSASPARPLPSATGRIRKTLTTEDLQKLESEEQRTGVTVEEMVMRFDPIFRPDGLTSTRAIKLKWGEVSAFTDEWDFIMKELGKYPNARRRPSQNQEEKTVRRPDTPYTPERRQALLDQLDRTGLTCWTFPRIEARNPLFNWCRKETHRIPKNVNGELYEEIMETLKNLPANNLPKKRKRGKFNPYTPH